MMFIVIFQKERKMELQILFYYKKYVLQVIIVGVGLIWAIVIPTLRFLQKKKPHDTKILSQDIKIVSNGLKLHGRNF